MFCGRHTSVALRGSPNFAFSALATSRSSDRGDDLVAVSLETTSSAPASIAASNMASAARGLRVEFDDADMIEHEGHRAGFGESGRRSW